MKPTLAYKVRPHSADDVRRHTVELNSSQLFFLLTRACEVGGAILVAMALTPYGGWHGEKDPAASWTHRTTHTGDDVGYYAYEFDHRFEHPWRTWASATRRAI